jgi:TolA-binding protein
MGVNKMDEEFKDLEDKVHKMHSIIRRQRKIIEEERQKLDRIKRHMGEDNFHEMLRIR